MIPVRRNLQADSFFDRLSPAIWKSSVRTASEVSIGSGSSEKTDAQTPCQSSDLSMRARIAPVSISTSTAILFSQALANGLTDGCRATAVAGTDRADDMFGDGV